VSGAAGCAEAGPDVASLGDPADSGPTVNAQALKAEAMNDCLAENGVPAEPIHQSDGQTWIEFGAGELWEACFTDGSCGGGGYEMPSGQLAEAQRAIDRIAAPYRPNPAWVEASDFEGWTQVPFLIVGSVDYTEEFASCLVQTGYEQPVSTGDTGFAEASTEEYIRVTNEWAACARENGLPEIEDVQPARSGEAPNDVSLLLNVGTAPDVLRMVLKACPNFDQEAIDSWPERQQSYEPWIMVNIPEDADDETLAKGAELDDVLGEPVAEYLAKLPRDHPWFSE